MKCRSRAPLFAAQRSRQPTSPPLAKITFKPAVHVKDSASTAVLDLRMPSSYVYLSGSLTFTPMLGDGGEIKVFVSDNNGMDWKEVATVTTGGAKTINLKRLVFRRYVYLLRFVMKGKGTGLDRLKLTHDIQHSQRALPALGEGENKIRFTAGPQEGTITIEGAMEPSSKGKQLLFGDFHPRLDGYAPDTLPRAPATRASPSP